MKKMRNQFIKKLQAMSNDPESMRKEKMRELFSQLARRPAAGNLILVTHAQNIHALTGVSASSGEMVVATLDEPGKFKVIGRLGVPGG